MSYTPSQDALSKIIVPFTIHELFIQNATSFPGPPTLGMRLEHTGLTLQVHCEVCDTWRALQVLRYRGIQEIKPSATLQCMFTYP